MVTVTNTVQKFDFLKSFRIYNFNEFSSIFIAKNNTTKKKPCICQYCSFSSYLVNVGHMDIDAANTFLHDEMLIT